MQNAYGRASGRHLPILLLAAVMFLAAACGAPEVVRQVAQADAQGYLANIWYHIEPGDP